MDAARHQNPDTAADAIIDRLGSRIVLGLLQGLSKANRLVNALYKRVAANLTLSLTIYTVLTLEFPAPNNELAQRFLVPLKKRFLLSTSRIRTGDARQYQGA